jgi:hypothetical protein
MHGLADSSASSSRPTDYSVGTNAINTTQAQRMVSKYFNSQHWEFNTNFSSNALINIKMI